MERWPTGMVYCQLYPRRKRYRIRPRSPLASLPPEQVQGVSIIRPLKGLDANLFENIESSLKQDYPKFEVLLAVAKEDDQAVPVVRDLLEKYPGVDATLVIGMFIVLLRSQCEEIVGVNPKVNNLMRPFRKAKHDILWIIDSNIQVTHDALARAVDALDPPESSFLPDKQGRRRIGLIHHVPLAFTTEDFLGARIEEAFLNTNHAKMYLALNALKIDSCVVGKSNLYRKSDVNRLTATLKPLSNHSNNNLPISEECGLPAFARFLAEDNTIASALWHELDVRHDLSCDVALNAIGDMNLSGYIWRRIRWIRVRKHMVLAATLLEPLTESVLLGLLSAWAARSLLSVPYWIFLPLHFILWLALDLDVFSTLAEKPLSFSMSFIQAWVYRELLAFPIWFFAVFGNEVEWRGQRYRITLRGEAIKVD
ncbi:hypothetical protein Clacol_006198 [Clathrus columnatus]|uniref:Ceramide glucosyltransferase n=1 Tax=Clathrus columnatus TaxID=1419009 RepID=A0AAV5AGD3_9AGAM|nr:hypothetical protein Clacol_006198 [Clathrus columnatus]